MMQITPADAAARLGSLAAELRGAFDDVSGSTDLYALLAQLSGAQRVLAAAYDRVAEIHEQAARATMRDEAENGDEPENRSWLSAAVSLREAAELARSSADALAAAHRQNGIARWYSDIAADL